MAQEWYENPGNPLSRLTPGRILAGLIALIVVASLWTSFFTVQQDSEAVVLRFGKYHRTVGPGLSYKLPFGMESVLKVRVLRQLKQEFGFVTQRAGARNESEFSREPRGERSMVTGDLNSALVEWVVQYRIENSRDFLFKVSDAQSTLRDLSEAVMRRVVGDRTVDEVITVGRGEIELAARDRLQELVTEYELGLRINQVQLNNVNPPEPVQASFNEVNRAQQQKEQTINLANKEYNEAVPRARGEADQAISEAEGYAIERVNEAQGDVARFIAILEQYRKAPEVTRQRLYLETMSEVLPTLGNKVVVDDAAGGVLPLLQLGKPSGPTTQTGGTQ